MNALFSSPMFRADQAPWYRSQKWDGWLLGSTLVLVCFGFLMILSASSIHADQLHGNALHFVGRQAVAILIGGTAAWFIIAVPWGWFRLSAWPLYLCTLLLLVLVMTPMGHEVNGARRWINLGFMNFQPSELAKLSVVLMLAHYLSNNEGRLRDLWGVVVPAISLVAVVLLLILFQKDLGGLVLVSGLAGVMLFIGGLDWRWLCGMVGVALANFAVLVWIEPFRVRRVFSFIDPVAHADGAGYQVTQGWIALASGGWMGSGLASGLAQQGYLPEAHNDFIMAVVGEELGAVGWCAVMALYGVLLWRGMVIAERATDLYGMLIAAGATILLAAQVVVNVGVVAGLMPPTGGVLPLLSYGASAAIIHVVCIGLVLRVNMETWSQETDADDVAAPGLMGATAAGGR